jgi:Kef-type K+ transport system membrane component KefB
MVELHGVMASLVDISSPKGPPWEFLVVFATLLLGPILLRRAGVPGIVGLLVGGYVIGPHGLNLIGSGNSTLPDLGQLGLLYLMFVAGVELDLNLLRRHRRSAVVFGLLTFALPMMAGTTVGFALGWEAKAAILLGSLLASHTLLTYPAVRDAGQASDPAVATAVGSTVLTDTLALVVLAGVAGSVSGGRSPLAVAVQIGVGLAVLIAFSLLVLPVLAGWAFRWLSAERSVRYVVAITAFLSAATVAEVFGIEGIVGAFFAGLALNRLVPNEGQLMDRIDFFGGAVFVPVFLVSVGLILDPAVMAQPATLKLAGLFILACLGGKAVAAMLSARLLGFSRPQAGLLFSLSAAQAAATLAATVVGFQIGLFDSSVVNAVLVLIFVSVTVSTLVATRASNRLTAAEHGPRPLGTRVIVGVGDPELARGALAIAVRIARADGGVVLPVLVVPESAPFAPKRARERLGEIIAAAGVDGLPATIVDRSLLHGAIHAGTAAEATLVLVADHGETLSPDPPSHTPQSHTLLFGTPPSHTPVALVRGSAERLGTVRTLLDGHDDDEDDDGSGDNDGGGGGQAAVIAEMARRVAGGPAYQLDDDDPDWTASLAPEDVTFVSARTGETLSTLPNSGRGMVVTTLSENLVEEQG